MKINEKKIIRYVFRGAWIFIGIVLLITAFCMWIKMTTFQGNGFAGIGTAIGLGLLFGISLSAFVIYAIITILFLVIRKIIKKIKEKRKRTK